MIPVQPPNISNPISTQSVAALRPLGDSNSRAALLNTLALPQKVPTLAVGEQVSARIAEQLANNQVAVLIKSALFTLTLPPGFQLQGDTLNLKVASLKPSVTFSFSEEDQPSETNKDASAQVELSPASRYLTSLLSAADQDAAGDTGAQSGKSGGGALGAGFAGNASTASAGEHAANLAANLTDALIESAIPNAGDRLATTAGQLPASMQTANAGHAVALDAQQEETAQVAQTLKQGVSNSGLFYESHLQAWDQGKLPLEQLQLEPQAKVGQLLTQNVLETRSALPELGNLVQRQLTTLENQQVPVQGFAWPGQPMQLVIQQEKTEDRQGKGEEDAQHWTTHLALNLPVLGGLSARLRMVGSTVQVSFVTEESAAEDLIQQNSPRLEAGLAAAGLSLATLSVKHEETPQT
jgi:flagellar hook-length control protein FliK